MNYQSQEEHDHFEGAMEQSLPQQETLQDRLIREARENYKDHLDGLHPGDDEQFYIFKASDLDTLISHTISETIKAGVSVIEGENKDEVKWKKAKYDVKSVEAVCFNRGLQTAVTKLQELQDKK